MGIEYLVYSYLTTLLIACLLGLAIGYRDMKLHKKKSSSSESAGPSNTKVSSSPLSTFAVSYSFTNAADGRKRIFTQRGVPSWSILSLTNTKDSVSGKCLTRDASGLRTSYQRLKSVGISLHCACGEAHFLKVDLEESLDSAIESSSSGSISISECMPQEQSCKPNRSTTQ